MSYLAWLGATELSVHRADAALVIGEGPDLNGPRAHDALELSCQFVPNLWTKFRRIDPPPSIRMLATDMEFDTIVGVGDPVATVRGTASDLCLRLWGRPATHLLDVAGDPTALDAWSTSSPTGPID
jgi:hypothetical protein